MMESRIEEQYLACLKYIAVRIRCTKEVIDYLKRRNVMDEDIELVIDKLSRNKV